MPRIEISPELLTDLKEKAEKATPGPWVYFGYESGNGNISLTVGTEKPGRDICKAYSQLGHHNCSCNTDFIAAVNPAVVLALIEKIERLEKQIFFQQKAMTDYKKVAELAWGGEIPSPLPGHVSSEEKMIEQFAYLNCPCCGGSGHVGDCDNAVQEMKCKIEKLEQENEELRANNYGPEILNNPHALTTCYFAGRMAEGREKNSEMDKLLEEKRQLEKEADWLATFCADLCPNVPYYINCQSCDSCPGMDCEKSGKPESWRELARKMVAGEYDA